MSSFPQHNNNLKDLVHLGFNLDEYMEDGEATYESWGYDELVYIIQEVVHELKECNFQIRGNNNDN